MTIETFTYTMAIIGVTPAVLCCLYAMAANISLIVNPTVWHAAIIVWGLVISPIVFATGFITGVSIAYWGTLLTLYLGGLPL